MKIVCLPIEEDCGLRSRVSARFCDARSFLLVETHSLTHRAIPNVRDAPRDAVCDARRLLRGAAVDLFILGDGEAPSLDGPVTRAPPGTVADALAALIAGKLPAPV